MVRNTMTFRIKLLNNPISNIIPIKFTGKMVNFISQKKEKGIYPQQY